VGEGETSVRNGRKYGTSTGVPAPHANVTVPGRPSMRHGRVFEKQAAQTSQQNWMGAHQSAELDGKDIFVLNCARTHEYTCGSVGEKGGG